MATRSRVLKAEPPARAVRSAPRFANRRPRSTSWRCPHPSQFAILVVYELHDVVLQISGELDLGGRDAFDACVQMALGEHPRRLVLELSALTFTDVVGLDCFSRARQRAEDAGVELILDSPNEYLCRLIDLAGASFRVR